MEKCFEYFGCKKEGCPAYGSKDRLECWGIVNTHCNNPYLEVMEKSLNACKSCLYYKMVNASDSKY
jgi:hypothetical protein